MLGDFRSRWGVEQSPVVTVALILAAVALIAGTIGEIMWLTAGDFSTQDDGYNLFVVALPAALGTAGLSLKEAAARAAQLAIGRAPPELRRAPRWAQAFAGGSALP